ncbi:MAG: DUF1553 domain-containing protein [Planctomyces sp.]|nr:DUF1553 domain-containing protein [Planctomyces sp.]
MRLPPRTPVAAGRARMRDLFRTGLRRAVGLLFGAVFCLSVATGVRAADVPAAEIEFFESQVRPLLVAHCYECHSGQGKVQGGLRLDAAAGWLTGGDTGPAIVPGDSDSSLLIQAIRYDDTALSMPPQGRLPEDAIRVLTDWVSRGAAAPADSVDLVRRGEIDWVAARAFWAYRPPERSAVPQSADSDWPRSSVDQFLLARLEAAGLRPSGEASRETLIRRLSFDLIGLPPEPEAIDAFIADASPGAYERLVDRLLASPEFGERWARRWLDVVRYGESLTLRGFVLDDAWRYRDYVIEAFELDRPFDAFVREQIAGDLLPAESIDQRQRQLVATTFLALGNTNLEEQDKRQLDMDVVDEQLDVLGRAFLGQTLGCARCHDHKFDPIPTQDYYALAGILRNTQLLEHENVSKWTRVPLPLPPDEEEWFAKIEAEIAELTARLAAAKGSLKGGSGEAIPVAQLPGIVVDDRQARRVGLWQESQSVRPFVGEGYLHDQNSGQGEKTLTFSPIGLTRGTYEVRLAYTPADNRASNALVSVFSADGEREQRIDMRKRGPIDGLFVGLGEFRFETDNQSYVIVSNEGADGHVVVDAVQFLPAGASSLAASAATSAADQSPDLQADIARIEKELTVLKASAPDRPMTMAVVERPEVSDAPIHIRGSVHALGAVAPRGVLRAASFGTAPEFPANESGRRELAEWIVAQENPLTARVFVNRVWMWLFDEGLVRSVDNFGATGEPPSHPELLDHLAIEFRDSGWSMKNLVRMLVLTQAYRQASNERPDGMAIDPENRLLWRMPRKRLDAECLRDGLLSVSGQLASERGGSTIPAGTVSDFSVSVESRRRSVYLPVFRNSMPPLLEAFDFPDPSMVTGRRNRSTIVSQALFLMNDPFVTEQAGAAAARLAREMPDASVDERIEQAFRRCLGRLPSVEERRWAHDWIARDPASPDAWQDLFHALFASLDFRYGD